MRKTYGELIGSEAIETLAHPVVIDLFKVVQKNNGMSMDELFELHLESPICITSIVSKCIRLKFLTSTMMNNGVVEYFFNPEGMERVKKDLTSALIILMGSYDNETRLGTSNMLELFDEESILSTIFELSQFIEKGTSVKAKKEELVMA